MRRSKEREERFPKIILLEPRQRTNFFQELLLLEWYLLGARYEAVLCTDLQALPHILGPYHCHLSCTTANTDWDESVSRLFLPCVARRRTGLSLSICPSLICFVVLHRLTPVFTQEWQQMDSSKLQMRDCSPVQRKNMLQAIKSRWVF